MSNKIVWLILGVGVAYVFFRGLSNLNVGPAGTAPASGTASAVPNTASSGL